MDILSGEGEPRRDADGASCEVVLLSVWNETTDDARESDGMVEVTL